MSDKLRIWWRRGGGVTIEYIDRRGFKAAMPVLENSTLSVPEIARLMGVSRVAALKWITQGHLPKVKAVRGAPRGFRVLVSDVRKFAVERGYFMGVGK